MADPQDLYRRKLLSIPDAVGLLQSNQSVCVAMATSEPPGLLTELGRQKDRLWNVCVWVCLPMREYDFVYQPEMAGHFFVENWFYGVPDRRVHPQGRISYIPNNLHAAAAVKLQAAGNRLDVFWGTATPPDKRGYLSLSLGLVIEKQMIEAADLVVLEVNENLPWTLGDTQIHVSDVDYVVENHCPLFELPIVPSTDWERAIGGHIAELIEDGSTIQLGIGGIPNAITAFLMDRRDLGVHTEMFTDGMVDLYNAGVLTGKRKTLWKEKMVGAFALGTRKLYEFLDDNLIVEFQQGKVTNNPYVVGQNYRMVSVNTALQVDLLGQVCSQSIGHRHFSGTGGQLDTHRGAQMSPGGRGIIALRSTAKEGTISSIVPTLPAGAGVTVPSQDVDTIVTEYGIAELKGRCVKDRMETLIRIAHPDFRAWIREEAERLEIVPRLVVPGAELRKPPASVPTDVPGVTSTTIKLGTFTDLSGPNAQIGIACYRGYAAFYNHVNRCGGVHGRQIELVVEDTAFDPTRAKLAAMKLVGKDKVFAIVSPLGTPTNLAARDYLLEKGVPVISPHSGITEWSQPRNHTYIALQPNYETEGRLLAQLVVDELRAQRISTQRLRSRRDAAPHVGPLDARDVQRVAVFSVKDQYGDEGSGAFVAELKAAGYAPVAHVTHAVRDSDPAGWLRALQEAQPDVVLLYTYPKPATDLLVTAYAAGFRPQWLGSYVLSGPEMFLLAGNDAVDGLLVTSYPAGPRRHRGAELYRKLMTRELGEEQPGPHSLIGYAAAQLVVEGLRRAGPDLTRAGFIAAIESLQDWTGGLLPPIGYSQTDHRGLCCLALHRARRGRWLVERSELILQKPDNG